MPKSTSLDAKYPNISRFIEAHGWIEIGQHEVLSAFIRAYDEGGTVYEGQDSYPTLEAALEDLDQGIANYMEEHGID
jgi:hypothetical protein